MSKNLFIVGPTCAGKNDFAYELSKHFDIEIINADSIQVYRQLKILSNRPNEKELKIDKTRLKKNALGMRARQRAVAPTLVWGREPRGAGRGQTGPKGAQDPKRGP